MQGLAGETLKKKNLDDVHVKFAIWRPVLKEERETKSSRRNKKARYEIIAE